MSKRDFKAIVLDLFDTLVKWEPDRLPLMEVSGRRVHTTMPFVLPKLEERLGERFDQQGFIDVYATVVDEIGVEREREGVEITCFERFARTLKRLTPLSDDDVHLFAEDLTRVHMAGVRAVTWAPQNRVQAVRQIAPHYRLGLLSNFDDAQCGRDVLLDTGVADLFEAVIISAEVGLRKPNPRIYQRMLEMLRLEPHEVLFVGDTPREDVAGPQQAGMRTAWISRGASAVPEGIPKPHFIITDLAELPRMLEV
jgi:HAD superfamily hydrolase (TIGR01549 family)